MDFEFNGTEGKANMLSAVNFQMNNSLNIIMWIDATEKVSANIFIVQGSEQVRSITIKNRNYTR